MRATAAVVLILLFTAPSVISQIPDDRLIVPGQRIGKWGIGATVEDLTAMNGPGSDLAALGEDVQPGWRERNWSSLGLRAGHRRAANRIEYLALEANTQVPTGLLLSFRTAERVGYLSRLSEVMRDYGTPPVRTTPGTIVIELRERDVSLTLRLSRLIYDEKGIAFTTIDLKDVFGIVVFPPGTAKTVWKF